MAASLAITMPLPRGVVARLARVSRATITDGQTNWPGDRLERAIVSAASAVFRARVTLYLEATTSDLGAPTAHDLTR